MVAKVDDEVFDWTPRVASSADTNEMTNICFETNEPSKSASPSLRNCYGASVDSCCNFVEDAMIADQLTDFVPAPCQGDDDHKELNLYQCMSCQGGDGGINNFTEKAIANTDFVQTMIFFKNEQFSMTDILDKQFKNDFL